MIAALDAAYTGDVGFGAAIFFESWDAHTSSGVHVAQVDEVEPYRSGAFYRRELPVLIAALRGARPHTIIIDGYAWLAAREPGLGAHLFSALDGAIPVIGVAKTKLRADDWSAKLYRGGGARPLYVTSAGMAEDEAAKLIGQMTGEGRLPLMLKLVDRAARQASVAIADDLTRG